MLTGTIALTLAITAPRKWLVAAGFADYRLRVAEVRRDYGLVERDQAPPDSRQQHG